MSQMDRASDAAGEGHATSRLRTNAANTAARIRRLRPIVNDGRDPSLIDRHAVRPLTPNFSAHAILGRFYKLLGVRNG